MQRGAVTKEQAKLVNVWFPIPLLTALDVGVRIEDSDRAKFIRNAVREKAKRMGVKDEDLIRVA
jgi:hypothetical protein